MRSCASAISLDNAGAVAEMAIFRAPDPGQTGTVSARKIAEAVRQHQIIGLDTRGIEQVSVTRASCPHHRQRDPGPPAARTRRSAPTGGRASICRLRSTMSRVQCT